MNHEDIRLIVNVALCVIMGLLGYIGTEMMAEVKAIRGLAETNKIQLAGINEKIGSFADWQRVMTQKFETHEKLPAHPVSQEKLFQLERRITK